MTFTGPDLSAGIAASERLMDDQVAVYPPEAAAGGFNRQTMTYDPPTVDPVYEGIARFSRGTTGADPRGSQTAVGEWTFKVPRTAPDLPDGSAVLVVSSRWEEWLVGRRFLILRHTARSLAIDKTFVVALETPTPAGD